MTQQEPFDFMNELNKATRPREKTTLEKALELADQLVAKIDDIEERYSTK
jgi:hypothetical protein